MPAQCFECKPAPGTEAVAFLLQEFALLLGSGPWPGADPAACVNNAMPRDTAVPCELGEDLADPASVARKASFPGDLPIGGEPSLGDAVYDGEHPLKPRVLTKFHGSTLSWILSAGRTW